MAGFDTKRELAASLLFNRYGRMPSIVPAASGIGVDLYASYWDFPLATSPLLSGDACGRAVAAQFFVPGAVAAEWCG